MSDNITDLENLYRQLPEDASNEFVILICRSYPSIELDKRYSINISHKKSQESIYFIFEEEELTSLLGEELFGMMKSIIKEHQHYVGLTGRGSINNFILLHIASICSFQNNYCTIDHSYLKSFKNTQKEKSDS